MKGARAEADGECTYDGKDEKSTPSAYFADCQGVDKPSVNTKFWPSAGLPELLLQYSLTTPPTRFPHMPSPTLREWKLHVAMTEEVG